MNLAANKRAVPSGFERVGSHCYPCIFKKTGGIESAQI
jgi:hypothetical protein